MSFSLQILDDILIKKVVELDNKIKNFKTGINPDIDYTRLNKLENRISIIESQCKILSDLFNVCRNHTLDNKLIQTMLLDLTESIHNNSIEISLLKDRHNTPVDKITNPEYNHVVTNQHYIKSNILDNGNRYEYNSISGDKWTKVKNKKKTRKR